MFDYSKYSEEYLECAYVKNLVVNFLNGIVFECKFDTPLKITNLVIVLVVLIACTTVGLIMKFNKAFRNNHPYPIFASFLLTLSSLFYGSICSSYSASIAESNLI